MGADTHEGNAEAPDLDGDRNKATLGTEGVERNREPLWDATEFNAF